MRIFKYLFVIVLFSAISASAQPEDPAGDPDAVVPITGFEYLLLAGGALGGYKLFKRKKDEEHTHDQ